MTAIIKNTFRLRQAKDFLENFIGHPIVPPTLTGSHAVDRNHYLFVGRSRPWPIDIGQGFNELAPPPPRDNLASDRDLWDTALGFKKIQDVATTLVVPRFDWDASGLTIYKPFDDGDPNLFYHPTPPEIAAASLDGTYKAGSFFIMTDEYHVFKCLSNNNGAKSTVKPTLPLSAPYISATADGYRWKYMCSVSPAQVLNFLTDQWIPVKTLTSDDGSTQYQVQTTAISGALESFLIDNVGSGYTNVLAANSLVSATSNTAKLHASASSVTGAYIGCTIFVTGGTGFPSQVPRLITAYDGPTQTATLDATWTAGGTTIVEVWPTISISGNGSGASAKLVIETTGINAGKVKNVVVTSVGTGYTFASASISGGAGSGALVRPMIGPISGHGTDVERELGAFFAMLSVRLAYNEGSGDFPISNDYRTIGVIRDLKNADNSLANANTRIASKSLLLAGVSSGLGGPFQPDEDITAPGGITAKIVEFSSGPAIGEGTIHFWQDPQTGYGTFTDGLLVTGAISGATGTIKISGVVPAEVKKNSGDILYVEHRRPVLRAPDQIEDLKVIIEF